MKIRSPTFQKVQNLPNLMRKGKQEHPHQPHGEPPQATTDSSGQIDDSVMLILNRRTSTAQASISSAPTPGPSNPSRTEDFVDDSALDKALSDDEDGFSSMNLADHLSKIETAPPADVPPREGLYSTPLSWERPQPGLRMDSLIGLNNAALNEAEQRRLIAIAMNPGPSMGGLGSNVNINFGGFNSGFIGVFGQGADSSYGQGLDPVSPPKAPAALSRPPPPHPPKKQGSISEKGKEKPKPGDRTAHNDIERKYRTNLKDKIAELRDAVPALQTIAENGEDDGSQPSRGAKVSKVSFPLVLLKREAC